MASTGQPAGYYSKKMALEYTLFYKNDKIQNRLNYSFALNYSSVIQSSQTTFSGLTYEKL